MGPRRRLRHLLEHHAAGPMIYPNFCGPSYASLSTLADAEELINLYVERMEAPSAPVQMVLYPTPGVLPRIPLPHAPVRGLFGQEGRAFVIAGAQVSEFKADNSVTDIDVVAQDGNPATMTTNGDGGGQLFITSGNNGYVVDLTTMVLTKVVNNGALMGAMLNGRFIALDAGTSKISASNVFDGLTWGPLTWTQRSTASDPWRAMLVSTDTAKIYAIGELTGDVYYDNGNSPFPYVPISGTLIPWGTGAPFSLVDDRGKITWLAQNKDGDRVVVRLQGYTTAQRISTHAMEAALRKYARVDDAEAFLYQEDGHTFYVLNFPSAKATWVYDDEGGWHRRGTWNTQLDDYGVWRARHHIVAFGRHIVGDRATGTLYDASIDFGLDFGAGPIRRVRRTPGLQRELEAIAYPGLRLYLENGLGLVTGQGADPKVLYRYSNDGGRTFGPFRERSVGKQGQYKPHIDFLLNGMAENRVDEIVMTDAIPWRILGAFLLDDTSEAA
jgi:hypothetical protein